MSYTVLARRYRSSTFDEVVGQNHVAQTLKRAIETGRIAHAYLFCGTRGVGKTSMARIVAKALNCLEAQGPTTEPCGKCQACLAIARGDDMDVIEIDAASNTGVDNVREIIENSQYRPAHSRFKVYIIDEVHMLSKSAFNALLKTLEEPPEHVKFILATTEPEKVLPTILSRCQRYDFRNIASREIAEHLREICKAEKIKADEDALLLIAKAGAGSMRDSLSLLDRLLSIGEKQLTAGMIEQLLGMPRSQVIFELAQGIGEADVKRTLEVAAGLISGGLSPDTLVSSLSDHLRNLLILRTCGIKSGLVEVPGMAIEQLNEQAQKFTAILLSQDIAILEELRRSLRSSQAGRALLDATLVRLALAEQFATVNQLLDGLDGAGEKKKSGAGHEKVAAAVPAAEMPAAETAAAQDDDDDLPRPGKVWESTGPSLKELLAQQAASPAPAGPAPQPGSPDANVEPVNPKDLKQVWMRLLGALTARGPSLPPLLADASLVGIEDDQAILRYPHGHDTVVRMLDRNGKKDAIRDALSGVLGRNVGIRFELAAEEPPQPAGDPAQQEQPAPPTAPPQRRAQPVAPAPAPSSAASPGIRITAELRQKLLEENELIREIVEKLGGEIVKVE